jgi:hypothetical protein
VPTFQLLRCDIALGGDNQQVVRRHRGRPIAFPELPVLQFLHGEGAVTEVYVVGEFDATNDEVLDRLRVTYRGEVIKEVYPGTRPRLPLGDGTIPRCVEPLHVAPPTRPANPDPVLRSLSEFTLPAPGQRVVTRPTFVPNAPDGPLDTSLDTSLDTLAGHGADEAALGEDDPFVGLADELGLPAPAPRPDMPDAAAYRARHNVRGQGTAAPRTADHLPDVAGGANRPQVAYKDKAAGRG